MVNWTSRRSLVWTLRCWPTCRWSALQRLSHSLLPLPSHTMLNRFVCPPGAPLCGALCFQGCLQYVHSRCFHDTSKGKYVSDDSFSFLVTEKNHCDMCFLKLKFYRLFLEKSAMNHVCARRNLPFKGEVGGITSRRGKSKALRAVVPPFG